jgi:hypothetical protein
MKQFLKRLTLESPKFFRRLRNQLLALSGIAAGIIAAQDAGSLHLPEKVIVWCGHLVAAGVLAAIVAQSTAKKPPEE